MDPTTVNSQTVLLEASGGDGIFGNNNNSQDRFIPLSGKLSYDAAASSITIGLASLGLNLATTSTGSSSAAAATRSSATSKACPSTARTPSAATPTGPSSRCPPATASPAATSTTTFAIDTHPPAIVAGTVALAPDSDAHPNDKITSNPTPTFTGQITDIPPPVNAAPGPDRDRGRLHERQRGVRRPDAGTATTDAQGFFSITLTRPLPDSPNYNVGTDGIAGTADDYRLQRRPHSRRRPVGQHLEPQRPERPRPVRRRYQGAPRHRHLADLGLAGHVASGNGSLQVAIAVNENLDPLSLTTQTIQVSRSGGDGVFGNGNDVTLSIVPGSIKEDYLHTPSGSAILRFTINGVNVNDVYRVTLVGSGTGVTDIAGNLIDGETSNGLPSGDGTPGGDFNLDFIILQPGLLARRSGSDRAIANPNPTGTRNDPYTTINAGLAAAGIGDTVAVLAGTASGSANVYRETVTMKSLVKLVSADPSSTDGNIVPGNPLKAIIRPDDHLRRGADHDPGERPGQRARVRDRDPRLHHRHPADRQHPDRCDHRRLARRPGDRTPTS